MSIQTDGLRMESLEWDLNKETVRVYLERIPEESDGRMTWVTLEARDCAAEWVSGSEGFRYAPRTTPLPLRRWFARMRM